MARMAFVATVFFALGWLLHRPKAPAPETPASLAACAPVPCEPVVPKTPKRALKKKLRLDPPLPPDAPTIAEDAEKLRECFAGERYAGSSFALELSTGNSGEVKRARLVGDTFMEPDERRCVREHVMQWNVGRNTERELVIRVTL